MNPQKKYRIKKRKLKKKADELWHLACIKKWGNKCFFHSSYKKARAHFRTTTSCHHIKPKSLYGHLRYDLDNGLPVCWPCHYKLEKVDRSMILDVRNERSKKWYASLEKKAREKIVGSYQTIKYYEKVIEKLKKYLNS